MINNDADGPTIHVQLGIDSPSGEPLAEQMFGEDCGYRVVDGGVLQTHGRAAEGGPTVWRSYAPGRWIEVRALIPPDTQAD